MLQALQYSKQNDTKTVFPQSAWVVPYGKNMVAIKKMADSKINLKYNGIIMYLEHKLNQHGFTMGL